MNRPLKFRAWDKENKKMYKVMTLDHLDWEYTPTVAIAEVAKKVGIKLTTQVWREIKYLTLMQYTGLKDKNGKEIYEGDIVSYKTFYYGNEKEHKKEIKWEQWDSDDFGEPHCIGYFNVDSGLEVIGNIYENPNLLGKEE